MKLLVFGFDGFAKVVIDSFIENDSEADIIILDDDHIGETFSTTRVVGEVSEMKHYYDSGYREAFISNANDPAWRKEIAERAKEIGFSFVCIQDKSAIVSSDVSIGPGSYVGKRAVVEPLSRIGENVIINSGVIIQALCEIGDYTRLDVAATICEGVKIGKDCHVGVRSIVTENSIVSDYTTIEDVSVYE